MTPSWQKAKTLQKVNFSAIATNLPLRQTHKHFKVRGIELSLVGATLIMWIRDPESEA
jgi:hypothetical protein